VAKKRILPKDPAPVRAKPAMVRRRPKPEELKYDDALAALRSEMGENAPQPQPPSAPADREGSVVDDPVATAGEPQVGGGAVMDPELAKWLIDTKRHVRSVWITPPEFLSLRISTQLQVRLGPGGDVIGSPVVVRSSGDPYWDDNAVRALMKASPLPAPPEAGEWPFVFSPEE
jgi:colicin import membrane protein